MFADLECDTGKEAKCVVLLGYSGESGECTFTMYRNSQNFSGIGLTSNEYRSFRYNCDLLSKIDKGVDRYRKVEF